MRRMVVATLILLEGLVFYGIVACSVQLGSELPGLTSPPNVARFVGMVATPLRRTGQARRPLEPRLSAARQHLSAARQRLRL